MSKSVGSPGMPVGRTGIAISLILGWTVMSPGVMAQDASPTEPSITDELLVSPALDSEPDAAEASEVLEETPSFEELDSAASDLNEALSGARAKLDELRQATELAAMAAELRDELEDSIQENNRLAASLAELQSEQSDLQAENSKAQRLIADLTETVESSKVELADQTVQLEQRKSELDEMIAARDNAEEQVRELESSLNTSGNQVGQLRGEIAELTGQLEATRAELGEANGNADLARAARDEADRELSKVRKQIAGMLRSVLLGGEPVDVSDMSDEDVSGAIETAGLGLAYEAIESSNVRAAPDADAARVGFAKRGDALTVISKVNGRNWFEIETADGIRGFIFGELIRPDA